MLEIRVSGYTVRNPNSLKKWRGKKIMKLTKMHFRYKM